MFETGKEIRAFRESNGWSRAKMADITGFSAVYLYKIETGERKVPLRLLKLLELIKEQEPGQ